MRTILKNFVHVLKRFKTSSILNLIGLSVALAVFLVILIQLRFDTSFNHNFEKVDNIYQVIAGQEYPSGMEYGNRISNEATSIITERYPEAKNYCQIATNAYARRVEVFDEKGVERDFDETVSVVNGNLMEIFQLNMLRGNHKEALKDGRAMVTESVAKKIFGDVSPIGKEVFLPLQKVTRHEDGVFISAEHRPIIIEAVCEDLPDNCSLNNGFFTYSSHYVTSPELSFSELYLEIPSTDISALEQKINTEEILSEIRVWKKDNFIKQDEKAILSMKKEIKLAPISNIHTEYPTVGMKGKSKNHLYYLISIAFFVLITAYINFVNFSTALAPARVRSLNIQKILGAGNFTLRTIIAFESALFTLLAFSIALFLVALYKESSVAQMFSSDPSIISNWGLIILLGIILLVFSFLIGIYPACFVTSFNQVTAVNSKSGGGVKGSKLRNVLLVIQLFFAIALITISLFIKLQHSYMASYDIGLNKDGVIYVETQTLDDKEYLSVKNDVFLQELLKTAKIEEYTASAYLPGADQGGTSIQQIEGVDVGVSTLYVDEHFCDFFDIKILESNGVPFNDRKSMINNKAKETYSELNLLGATYHGKEIVGIIEDFHFENIENKINPLLMRGMNINNFRYLFFKVKPENLKEAIAQIETTWKKYSSRPVNVQFLDESIAQEYQSHKDLGTILGLASGIIIAIALMGIYGMIIFNTRYREKEIAIRKVSGASVSSIIVELNKGLFVKVLIAFVLALPVIWIVVDKWLSQFIIKIPMYWWVYALGYLIILLIVVLTVSMQSYIAATRNPVDSLKSE